MNEKDYMTINKAEGLQKLNIHDGDFETDAEFKKKLLDDVLAENHDILDWDSEELQGRMDSWIDAEL